MAHRPYVAPNDAERKRLEALATRLSDADLRRPLSAGWTVAGLLAHLAFWDQRIVVLVERWRREGPAAVPPPLDHASVDWVNDAAKPMLLALPPREAARLVTTIAAAADAAVEGLPDGFVAANAAAGNPVRLLRAEHRREHLDEIERALA